ncbi:sortilin-related receptor [Biomphalaria pfeifferi]|uniref:Sortilin-related receptor n=1 Tax=Biomphalaria pfeifferi TaxID=112525 RepID=A0AAD8EYK6_BIOPF|nr:sortilin-related receptor [Biomphalaria pfeifferi]
MKLFLFLLFVLAVSAGNRRPAKSRNQNLIKRLACTNKQFTCKNGQCVDIEWVCDTVHDCDDFSDEVNCPTDCSHPNQLKCANGQCTSRDFICDGSNDCGDLSDEKDCEHFACPDGELKCSNFLCIESYWKCDGYNDCGNGWDEQGCTTTGK